MPIRYGLVLAAVVIPVWYAVVLVLAIVHRRRVLPVGPPTMELGPEPPAVVQLLVTGGTVNADAADATLLDLAARGILELHQPGDGLLVRIRQPQPQGLTDYERRLFDRMRAVAGDRLVPLAEVTARYTDGGPRWFSLMRAEDLSAPDPRRPGFKELGLDDGRSDSIRPWLVRGDRSEHVVPGAIVRIHAQPWTRYVLSVEPAG